MSDKGPAAIKIRLMQATLPQAPSDIETRLQRLEEQVARLLGPKEPKQSWRSSFGLLKDDSLGREIDELGKQWRESVTE
ncbi:MAG: hypothetical protein IPK32_12895 [Verrucomicrobiaceae bacterium]|nr:hypothetical protein [Verrucomicrobiaceae bacterium]